MTVRAIAKIALSLLLLKMVIGNTSAVKYTALMVHAEPYSWLNGTQMIGLIPDLLNVFSVKCENLTFEVHQVHWSLKQLKEITMNEDPLPEIKSNVHGINIDRNVILGMNNYPNYFKKEHKFLAYPFIFSRGIVAVVHRDTIGLGRKLYEAMVDSAIIMYNGLLLAVISGVIIWAVERRHNCLMFPNETGPGILNGIWLTIVTMATVGYGDMAPRTKLGKGLMMCYMGVATLLIAALTGVYTERVANAEVHINADTKMSVVNGTYDVEIAMRFHKNRGTYIHGDSIKTVRTYVEALKLVQTKQVEMALIDYNVAAWLQEDIIASDLRITKFIEQKFHKHIYIYEDHTEHEKIHELLKCFRYNQNSFDHALTDFVRPINIVRLDVTDMYYALFNIGITPIMSSIALLTFSIVLLYELYVTIKKRCQPKGASNKEYGVRKNEKRFAVKVFEKKLDDKLQGFKEELLRDYNELLSNENRVGFFDQYSEQNTERSDLFILN